MASWQAVNLRGRNSATRQPLFASASLRIPLLTAIGLFIVSLALYISTLAPSVVTLFDDSLEFQLVTYRLGIAHPTGYPFYTILGKLFTFIPVGDIAYRVNLMSAVFGAATVALLYLLILQLTIPSKRAQGSGPSFARTSDLAPTESDHGSLTPVKEEVGGVSETYRPPKLAIWPAHLGGVIGALLLAIGLVFWRQATVAEVYTLNAFFVTTLLLIAATIPQVPPNERDRRVLWLAFLAGLSLTHHRTMLLLLPALVIYLFLIDKSLILKPRTIILGTLLGLLPLLLYLYLPLRGHVGSLDGSYQNTWAGFWQQISASGYGLFIFGNPFDQEHNLGFYWNLLADQFYTTVPGFIGILYLLWLRHWKIIFLTVIALLTYTSFNIYYNVSYISVFFIPVFLLWTIWSGIGATFLLQTFSRLKHARWRPVLTGVVLVVFAINIIQLFLANRTRLSHEYAWQVHDYGLDILQQPPPGEQATIVGILGEMTLVRYFQQTENRRPDVETVAADLEPDRLATVEKLLAESKTVYLTRKLPGAPQRWSLNATGPLIRVDPEPITLPPDISFRVDQTVTPAIKLLGYNLSRPPHSDPGPAPVRLNLFWQVTAPLTLNLKVSARLLNPAGEAVAVVDAVPVHFTYPTTSWRSGEIISDVYDLPLPADTPSDQYTPLLIWYNPDQNAAEIGRIELEPVTIEEEQ